MATRKRQAWGDRSERARRFAAARILNGLTPAELDEKIIAAELGGQETTYRIENGTWRGADAVVSP